MIFAGEGLALAELCLLVYCVLSIITTPDGEVRGLPKVLWVLLVIALPVVGGIAWLVAGRPAGPAASLPYKGNTGIPAAYDRPGRAKAASPDDDEAFLRGLRERADAQRGEAARRRRAELDREEQERRDAWRRRHGGDPTR